MLIEKVFMGSILFEKVAKGAGGKVCGVVHLAVSFEGLRV